MDVSNIANTCSNRDIIHQFTAKNVEKHSALLETNHEEQIPVDADHRAMCKFEADSDATFEKVYE
jgi:hypothetical protein